jgi:hypothetical protein
MYPWPTRDVGGESRFDPSDGNVYTGGLSGVPVDTGTDVGLGQILPRVGAAYRISDRTVVRAGYGHSADPKPYIDFRNAYPINFAWSHPQVLFNGATNAFIPVTTLRQGLDQARFGVPPDLTQGIIRLPTGAGTTTFPAEELRKYVRSWNVTVQRELYARRGTAGVHQHQRVAARHGQRWPSARAPRHRERHQHDHAVRRRDVPRASD